MLYNTGLLVGRAYALAHDPGATVDDSAAELVALADGDRPALLLAEARLREFVVPPSGSPEELQALRMLSNALERMSRECPPTSSHRPTVTAAS